MIIAIEGIDACGKGTQSALLQKWFEEQDREVRNLHFPHYETHAGGTVGRILRGDTIVLDTSLEVGLDLKVSDEGQVSEALKKQWSRDKATVIQSVMVADRLEWQEELLEWHGDGDGRTLILDRYKMSGIVYGQADGLTREWLRAIHHTVVEPDISILIDIPVEESFRRRPGREDYYERDQEKLEKVRLLYAQEFSQHACGDGLVESSYRIVDGTYPVDEVFESIKFIIDMHRDAQDCLYNDRSEF